jgi:hypothetical protein
VRKAFSKQREGGIDMKRAIIGAAVLAVALAAARRFGPALAQRAMNKCHQMMSKCGEMFGQQAGHPAEMGCMTAATPGSEQAAAGEHEPAEATAAS